MATARPVMFLRTALTEQRIEMLENQVEWMMKYLKVPPKPTESDEEWEAAAPKPEPIEPDPKKVVKTKR